MHTLRTRLIQKMQTEGPLSVADFMAFCLYDPKHGYYMTRDPFGAEGDFITAPELTQMFGEILAVWVADSWRKMGSPTPFQLLEGGPGRGTQMHDLLRTLKRMMPDCYKAARVTLLEVSPVLRGKQQERLQSEAHLTWAENIQEVSFELPTLFLANELLDAFPVHQYVRQADGAYVERLVDYCPDTDRFVYKPAGEPTTLGGENTADVVERSPEAEDFLHALKVRLKTGYALFIDYGAEGTADTFQALYKHQKVDPLTHVGEADLTAHVNFAAVRSALGAERCFGADDMSFFLTRLGLPARAAALLSHATEVEKQHIEAAAHRLLHPNEMGGLFKVLAYGTVGLPMPLGFTGVSQGRVAG